jgi:hypothetical protein
MRARKVKLPLSLDTLLATLVPGKPYTLQYLALLYEGGAQAIERVLLQGRDAGAIGVSANDKAYNGRIRYWLREDFRPRVAGPRIQPAHMTGPLVGYDLMALARLSHTFRRS